MDIAKRPRWRRSLWLAAGFASLLLGLLGAFLPVLPTTPFVILAAACFSRSSERFERWLLDHPRWGPVVADWRATRAVPLRAKQAATLMMAISIAVSLLWLPLPVGAAPAVVGPLLLWWLWRLPTRSTRSLPDDEDRRSV